MDDMQHLECLDGSDLKLDENREESVSTVEYNPSKAYNVQVVNNGGTVVIGDNSTFIFRTSEQRVKKLCEVPEDVSEEAQIGSGTVDKNITVNGSDITIIGSWNVIYLPQEDDFCLENPSCSEQMAHRQLPPVKYELLVMPLPGVEPTHKRLFNTMCGIVNQLYPSRDNGEMQEFEEVFNRLYLIYSIHPATKCFLLLEEGTQLSYEKRFNEAMKKAKEALKIVNNEASEISGALQDVLMVLAKIASASIFRRLPEKKLSEASKCLEVARERGGRLKGIDLAMPKLALMLLDYEQARHSMESSETVEGVSNNFNKEAAELLSRCIDRCRDLENHQLYTAKQHFAFVCLARLWLPSTTKGSEKPAEGQYEMLVEKQSLRQAERHLEAYQRSHSDSPPAAKVKYFIANSKLYLLKRDYPSAEDFACQALDIAREKKLKLEIAPARKYVKQISRHCSSTIRQRIFRRVFPSVTFRLPARSALLRSRKEPHSLYSH